jgi:AGCS family alanine or glycine:cation symporter
MLLNQWLQSVNDFIWGTPMLVLILGIGIFLSCRLKFIQIRHLPKALRYMLQNEKTGHGEVSGFSALCTALSATVGTGNIVGVATALSAGGPGALFWMWVAAIFGMATKFAECTLAVKYRKIDANGKVLGGPFMYIEQGLGKKRHFLARMFALFGAGAGLLGIGTITQINGIAAVCQNFFDPNKSNIALQIGQNTYSWTTVITAITITLLVVLIIMGGIKRIAKVTEIIVPFMMVFYFFSCIFVLITHFEQLPNAFNQILDSAFNGTAATGGFAGVAVKTAIQKGISRGIFSNEAGLGSAPIAAAAAQTQYPARQGLISMTGTFFDTIIICTMTGLAIICTDAWNQPFLQGVEITSYAFREGFYFAPDAGNFILMLCLIFFAFTTILGWNYYSEKCVEYLFNSNPKAIQRFRILFITALLLGPFLQVEAVWNLADIMNGLMAFPNLIALFLLSDTVVKETQLFFTHLKNNKT